MPLKEDMYFDQSLNTFACQNCLTTCTCNNFYEGQSSLNISQAGVDKSVNMLKTLEPYVIWSEFCLLFVLSLSSQCVQKGDEALQSIISCQSSLFIELLITFEPHKIYIFWSNWARDEHQFSGSSSDKKLTTLEPNGNFVQVLLTYTF